MCTYARVRVRVPACTHSLTLLTPLPFLSYYPSPLLLFFFSFRPHRLSYIVSPWLCLPATVTPSHSTPLHLPPLTGCRDCVGIHEMEKKLTMVSDRPPPYIPNSTTDLTVPRLHSHFSFCFFFFFAFLRVHLAARHGPRIRPAPHLPPPLITPLLVLHTAGT